MILSNSPSIVGNINHLGYSKFTKSSLKVCFFMFFIFKSTGYFNWQFKLLSQPCAPQYLSVFAVFYFNPIFGSRQSGLGAHVASQRAYAWNEQLTPYSQFNQFSALAAARTRDWRCLVLMQLNMQSVKGCHWRKAPVRSREKEEYEEDFVLLTAVGPIFIYQTLEMGVNEHMIDKCLLLGLLG